MKKLLVLILAALLLTSCVASTGETTPVSSVETTASAAVSAEVTVAETVLLDEAGVKITATGFDSDAFLGPELKILIENNADKNLTIQTRSASVNGWMVGTSISKDVAAGKKANSGITFMSSDL